MKRTLYIILFILLLPIIKAEDTIPVLTADSLPADTVGLELVEDQPLDSIDLRLFEWMLAGLDTTPCIAAPDTVALADSTYKPRLQALPCIVELPYNPVAKRYIQRYLKNPRHTARIMREAEYFFPIFEQALAKHGSTTFVAQDIT